jgi:CheY-like chemotaxis protein
MKKLKNILIIDDEEISRFVTTKMIANAGIAERTSHQSGGIKALAYLRSLQENQQNGPDVILLDLNLSDINGWQFMKEYEKLEPSFRSGIAIFILSNFVDDREIKAAARFSDLKGIYLKPLPEELLEEISCIGIQS